MSDHPAPDLKPPEPERKRPSRTTLTLIVAPIVGIVLLGYVGQAIFPTLLDRHPLALVALEPRNRNLLLVASKGIDFWPFLLVALARRVASDPLFYLLGHFYGEGAVRWAERKMGESGSIVRGIERAFAKAGWLMVFLFPGALVCALAGATAMPVWLFVVLNVVGTVTTVTLLYHLADVPWVEAPLDAVTGFITGNSRWLTVVSVILTLLWIWNERRQGKSEVASVDEIDRELEEAADSPATRNEERS